MYSKEEKEQYCLIIHKFKVKVRSLSEEQKIIQGYLNSLCKNLPLVKNSLRNHSKQDISSEIRSTLLAYSFYKGRRYKDIEKTTNKPLKPKEIHRISKILKSIFEISVSDDIIYKWTQE